LREFRAEPAIYGAIVRRKKQRWRLGFRQVVNAGSVGLPQLQAAARERDQIFPANPNPVAELFGG